MCGNMRRGWVLALGCGLGLAVLARADDTDEKPAKTGNWMTRLFVREPVAKKKDAKIEEPAAPAPMSPALLKQKAHWEWLRRLEVCDKLKQIALETGDQELARKAEALDQRAWDVYVQRTGRPKGNLTPDEQILDGQLGLEASQRTKTPAASSGGSAQARFDGRSAVRKD